MEETFVLDATVFLRGHAQEFSSRPCVTTHGVVSEVRSEQAGIALDMLLSLGMMVKEPEEKSVSKVRAAMKKTNDKTSETDVGIVALALELRERLKENRENENSVVLVSDDYGVQNLAKKLGIRFSGVAEGEISREITWTRKCGNCGRLMSPASVSCDFCGGEPKFRAKKKKA